MHHRAGARLAAQEACPSRILRPPYSTSTYVSCLPRSARIGQEREKGQASTPSSPRYDWPSRQNPSAGCRRSRSPTPVTRPAGLGRSFRDAQAGLFDFNADTRDERSQQFAAARPERELDGYQGTAGDVAEYLRAILNENRRYRATQTRKKTIGSLSVTPGDRPESPSARQVPAPPAKESIAMIIIVRTVLPPSIIASRHRRQPLRASLLFFSGNRIRGCYVHSG